MPSNKRKRSKEEGSSDSESDSGRDDSGNSEDEWENERNASEAEIGIVEEITLVNFMCHRNLHVQFGPNINFIVGQNGSGKSAILVGLAIGLGAKANFTNRGNKYSDLIRTGASTAIISIRLRNRGPEAYKPKEYGPAIIVERRLHREGNTAYKLKDHTGKRTVATSFAELSEILDQFNIQIMNPCAILMQDTSRQFLTTQSAKDKYKFFAKATQLEQMKNDYVAINEQLDIMKSTMAKKQKMIPELEKKLKECEHEYEELNTLRDLEKKKKRYQQMMAWAHVKEAEDAVTREDNEIEKFKREITKCEKAIQELQLKQEKSKADIDNKNALLNDLGKKLQTARMEKEQIEKELAEVKKEVSQYEPKHKDLSMRKQNLMKRKQKIEEHIHQTKLQIAKHSAKDKEKRNGDLKRKLEERDSINAEHQKAKAARQELEDKVVKQEEEVERVRHEENLKRSQKSNLQRDIKLLEAQKKDKIRVFGEEVSALLDSIKRNETRFKRMPLGPIGMLIKLTDDKWATAVETCLKARLLRSFVVDNEENDGKLLRQLAEQCRFRGLVYVCQRFRENSYEDLFTPDMIPDVIQTEHVMIKNVLIDQAGIERTILVESSDAAQKIMFPNPPHQVKECFTLDGSRLWVQRGSQNFVPSEVQRKFISVNYDERIQGCYTQIAQLDVALNSLSVQRKELEDFRNAERHKLESLKRELNKQQLQLNQLSSAITELENFREEPPPDTTELENSLKRVNDEIQQVDEQLKEVIAKMDSVKDKTHPYEKQLLQKTLTFDKLGEENETLMAGVNKTTQELQEITGKMEHLNRLIQQLNIRIEETEAKKARLKKQVEEVTAKATLFCPERVEVDKSCQTLDREIQALDRRIEREQQGRRSVDDVTREYFSAKKSFEEIMKNMNRLNRFRERVEKNLQDRVRRYDLLRKSIAKRTMLIFNSYLSQKGYSGSINFDHKEEQLDIQVQLENSTVSAAKNVAIRDTKALSGGERSYSTVSLLLALWDVMETPFRAMDEFDVFMDSVNRQISIKLLVEAAREKKQRQFIFITPHDHSVIAKGADVRITKMRPPERNQPSLSFSQSQEL